MIAGAREAMKTQQIHQMLNVVWSVVADANRYFAGEAPWALAKTDPARQGTVLYVTAEVIRQVAILAQPVMPQSAAKLLDLLAVPARRAGFLDARRSEAPDVRRRRCRRRARSSRAMSSRKQPRPRENHAGRQPLPSRLSRFCRRSRRRGRRARATKGVGRMVTISTRVRRHDGLLAIAERFPDVFCSVGTHPHQCA